MAVKLLLVGLCIWDTGCFTNDRGVGNCWCYASEICDHDRGLANFYSIPVRRYAFANFASERCVLRARGSGGSTFSSTPGEQPMSCRRSGILNQWRRQNAQHCLSRFMLCCQTPNTKEVQTQRRVTPSNASHEKSNQTTPLLSDLSQTTGSSSSSTSHPRQRSWLA